MDLDLWSPSLLCYPSYLRSEFRFFPHFSSIQILHPFEHPGFLNVGLFRADSAFHAFSSRTFISLWTAGLLFHVGLFHADRAFQAFSRASPLKRLNSMTSSSSSTRLHALFLFYFSQKFFFLVKVWKNYFKIIFPNFCPVLQRSMPRTYSFMPKIFLLNWLIFCI